MNDAAYKGGSRDRWDQWNYHRRNVLITVPQGKINGRSVCTCRLVSEITLWELGRRQSSGKRGGSVMSP